MKRNTDKDQKKSDEQVSERGQGLQQKGAKVPFDELADLDYLPISENIEDRFGFDANQIRNESTQSLALGSQINAEKEEDSLRHKHKLQNHSLRHKILRVITLLAAGIACIGVLILAFHWFAPTSLTWLTETQLAGLNTSMISLFIGAVFGKFLDKFIAHLY